MSEALPIVLIALILLACPVGMGVAMWWMSRYGGQARAPGGEQPRTRLPDPADVELTRLRAELDQLKAAERERRSHPSDQP
jgi:hypothetical protein